MDSRLSSYAIDYEVECRAVAVGIFQLVAEMIRPLFVNLYYAVAWLIGNHPELVAWLGEGLHNGRAQGRKLSIVYDTVGESLFVILKKVLIPVVDQLVIAVEFHLLHTKLICLSVHIVVGLDAEAHLAPGICLAV